MGLVFSIDPHATQYSALVGLQEPRLEAIADLRAMFKLALTRFSAYLPPGVDMPRSIIIFRDGVSEGEYERVRIVEMRAVRGT